MVHLHLLSNQLNFKTGKRIVIGESVSCVCDIVFAYFRDGLNLEWLLYILVSCCVNLCGRGIRVSPLSRTINTSPVGVLGQLSFVSITIAILCC